MKNIFLFVLLSFTSIFNAQTNYYVDNVGGNDNNAGTSENGAFQSLEKINTKTFLPGDSILFKKEGSWAGTLRPLGSGLSGNRIVIGSYGEGELPIIDGEGSIGVDDYMSAAIILYNQEYWEIRDIEVRNFEQGDPASPIEKAGILVLGKDVGTLHDFKLENVKISQVNGSLETRENGGVFFNIIRSTSAGQRVPTNFDGVYVNNCYFLDVDRGGFLNQSIWKTRDLISNFGEICLSGKTNTWFPSTNIVVENSKFENIGGNGLVIRVAEAPLVQYNLFVKNGSKTTGNASYPYNCDNALWQYNEACYTVYNDGDADASGFDSDYMCKNTTIENNYSHHNDWGGILVCSNSGLTNAFNDGTMVRKNVFQDESNHMIRFSGNITNSEVSNNLFVTDAKINDVMMWYKSWGSLWPDGTTLKENIFYNEGTPDFLTLGSTTNNLFSSNVLFGSEFTDFTNFVPGLEKDEEDLKSKIEQVREIGNRSELNVSQAESVINIVWNDDSTIVDIPVLNEVPVIEDSYIRGGDYSADNFNGTLMEVKESSSNNLQYVRRVWLKFDMSNYSTISSAILHISGNQSSGVPYLINVSETENTWSEGSISWDNAPAASSIIGSFSTHGEAGHNYQDMHIDVTSYIQNNLGSDNIVSMSLWAAESSSSALKISNKDSVGTAAYLSIIEGVLGIQDEVESKFTIYPNPTKNSFVIESLKTKIDIVKIFSMQGVMLFNNKDISSNKFNIDISKFKTGVYFVQIKNTQGASRVSKIIKN